MNNIFVLLYLVSVLNRIEDIPVLPEVPWENRRAARNKAIARNRRIAHALDRKGPWFDEPDENGEFVSYHGAQRHTKPQQGRWETERRSGHRRFQKWSRDYYDSFEVAKDKYFRRVDKKQEKLDAQRDADFHRWLTWGDEADDLLDELDELKRRNVEKIKRYYYTVDNNHTGVVFISKCKETLERFIRIMRKEGAYMSPINCGAERRFPAYSDVAAWPQCNIDIEWGGSSDIDPFYFWYYGVDFD